MNTMSFYSLLSLEIKNILGTDNTLELVSKRSGTEQSNGCGLSNMFTKRKESYSSAFLELLNSELKSDSPKNSDLHNEYKKEINVSGFNFDMLNYSESNSDEMSWNIITDKNAKWKNKKFTYSNEKGKWFATKINSIVNANFHQRKRSLHENKPCLINPVLKKDQQSEVVLNDEDLFKISGDKTSENSLLFDLSHSKIKDQKSIFAKHSKDESSDLFKDELSTLKDFSNLWSSKGSSMIESFKFGMLSRNNIKPEWEKDHSPRPWKSSNLLTTHCQKHLEMTESQLSNWAKSWNWSNKIMPVQSSFEMKRTDLNEAKSTNSNSLL